MWASFVGESVCVYVCVDGICCCCYLSETISHASAFVSGRMLLPNRKPCGREGVKVRVPREIHRVSWDSEQARTREAAVVTGCRKT